ncbi:ATP-binding cassette domain-containing protein [Streptomyces barkulensis]|uniref:ATP-binding cassette domain-containing protein n=1 Tax=Streptomyces barkulensis TaxID=1257026 RepID=UPI000C6D737E|nr:ATP-binding cassette domain-containing protein [Streptomyces barkulensis]
MAADGVIHVVGLHKRFGAVQALRGVDLTVARGEVMGLLGHNGAGKTTLVNILSTLMPPTAGTASVAGFDVAGRPEEVRRRIGVTGQFASLDEQLSGHDNLVLVARLCGASRARAGRRADELLEAFGLGDAGKRKAVTYSGGMRRRLDLALGLVGRPEILFLDEPTVGLDPPSRIGLWEMVGELTRGGTTVLLTTQYLEEADRLADRITVLEAGRVLVSGTAAELKSRAGGGFISFRLEAHGDPAVAAEALRLAGLPPGAETARGELTVPAEGSADLATVIRVLDAVGQNVTEIRHSEPSLDDVYLALTGARSRDLVPAGPPRRAGVARARRHTADPRETV